MADPLGINAFDPLPSEITDSDLLLVARDNVIYKTPVQSVPNGFTARKQVVAPLLSDFSTLVNFTGYQDLTQLEDGLRIHVDRRINLDAVACAVRTLPGGSWDIKLGLVKGFRHQAAQGGIILRESGTGKLLLQSYGVSTVPGWFTARWNSPTSFGAVVTNRDERGLGVMWQRFVKNGSNIEMYISVDGVAWKDMGSVAITTPFTTAPDQWGIFINGSNSLSPVFLDAIDWDE